MTPITKTTLIQPLTDTTLMHCMSSMNAKITKITKINENLTKRLEKSDKNLTELQQKTNKLMSVIIPLQETNKNSQETNKELQETNNKLLTRIEKIEIKLLSNPLGSFFSKMPPAPVPFCCLVDDINQIFYAFKVGSALLMEQTNYIEQEKERLAAEKQSEPESHSAEGSPTESEIPLTITV